MNNLSLSDEEEFDYEDYDLNKDDEDKLLEDDSTDNDVDIKKNEKSAPEAENEDDGEVLRLDIGEDMKLMESASESSKKENEHLKTTKDEKQQKNKERKVDKYDDLKRIRRISPVRSNRNTHRSRYRYNERKNSKYNYNRRKDRNNGRVNAILNFVPPPKYDDDDLTDRAISRSNNIEVHPQDKIRPDLLMVPNEQRTLIEVEQQSDYFIQQQQQVKLPSLLDIKTVPPYLNQHDESFNSINSFSQPLSLSQENLFKQQLQPPPISPQLWPTSSQQQQQQYQEPTSISPQLWPSTSQQQYQEPQFYQQQEYYQEEPQYYQQQHQQDYIYQQGNCENGQLFSRFPRNETSTTTQQNSNKGSVHSRLGVKKRIPPNNSNNHISNDSIDKIASPPPKQTALFVDEEYKRKMEEQKREREKIFKLKEERRLKDLTQQQQKFLQHKNKTNNTSNNNNNNNIVVKQLKQEKSTKILKTTTQLRSNNEVTKIDNVMPKKFTIKNELCEENIETVKNSNNSDVKLFMSDRLVVKKKAPLTNKPNIGRPLKFNTSIKSATSTATSAITTMTKKPSLLSLDHDNNRNIINVDNNRNNNISSFLNNRKIIAKDQQSRTPLIYISNLSVDTTKSRLLEIAQGIGEVQKIHHDPKERCATILFKDIAAAHLFYEQYQQYMLDLSVLDIRLVPRM